MDHRFVRLARLAAVAFVAAAPAAGCTSSEMSHTARTGVEQMLVSNAVDQALDKSDFHAFAGRNVFVEEKYLDCVDKPYILGSIRHRTLTAGATLVGKAEEADVVLEPRSGGVGTDSKDTFVGMPALQLPGPLPVSIPEVRLLSKTTQYGTAKLGLVAYDAKTKEVLGMGGVSLARADDNNWTVMGLGPWQNGSLRQEIHQGVRARSGQPPAPLPYSVAFGGREERREPDRVRLTGGDSGRGRTAVNDEPAGR